MRDSAIAGLSGAAATQVTSRVTTALQARQSPADEAREKAVSPGVAYGIAAKRTASAVGVELGQEQRQAIGSGLHWALGIGWAPVYLAFRRGGGLHPVLAGLLTGIALFIVVDEGANTVFGLAAPPRAYPASTHVRGAAGHAVYGLTLAALVETAWAALQWAGVDVHGTRRRLPWER